jgi:hypothetical protein
MIPDAVTASMRSRESAVLARQQGMEERSKPHTLFFHFFNTPTSGPPRNCDSILSDPFPELVGMHILASKSGYAMLLQ